VKTITYLISILSVFAFNFVHNAMGSELSPEVLTIIKENQKTIDSVKTFHAMTERIDHIRREQGNRTLYVVQEVWYDANFLRIDVKDSKFIGEDTTDLVLEEYPNGQKRFFIPPPKGSLDIYSKKSWISFYRGNWAYIHPYRWNQEDIINRCPILRYNMYRTKTLQKLVMDNANAGYIFKAQTEALNGQDCIFLTCNNPDDKAVTKVWIVPTKGYCIRKLQLIMSGKIIYEYETTLKEYSPGHWWFESVIQKRWRPQEEEPFENIELSVKSLSFNEHLDPRVFTIAGTSIPPGTKIRNKISGLDYVYERSEEMQLSLLGKSLPELKDLGISLSLSDVNDKLILVCFFDMDQRPSRNCILQLSKRTQDLAAKDAVVVTVQASIIEQAKLNEWIKENDITFPVGMIESDSEKTRFNWGAKSLPWLILTNKKHIVTAEGFNLDEIDEKITTLIEK
jgi:hypothetical protein